MKLKKNLNYRQIIFYRNLNKKLKSKLFYRFYITRSNKNSFKIIY